MKAEPTTPSEEQKDPNWGRFVKAQQIWTDGYDYGNGYIRRVIVHGILKDKVNQAIVVIQTAVEIDGKWVPEKGKPRRKVKASAFRPKTGSYKLYKETP